MGRSDPRRGARAQQDWTAPAARLAEQWLAPLLLGAAASLSQTPHSAWMALPAALSLIAWLHGRAQTPWEAARVGWAFGVGYFLPGMLWMGEAFLVEAERFAWMRPFAVTLLPMGLSLFWAAAFGLAARMGGGPLSRALALAALLTVAETLRSTVLTGLPWGLFVYALVETPLAQAAAWFGPFALNGWTILASLTPYFLLLAVKEPQGVGGAAARVAFGFCALSEALFWTAGQWRLDAAQLRLAGPTLRLVQPNVPLKEKWSQPHVRRNFHRLLELSGAKADGRAPDLVIWPEAATPYPLEEDQGLRAAVMKRLPQGAALAYGALRQEWREGGPRRVFNSLFVAASGPSAPIVARYDKHHLVPFGEYVPLESLLEPLGVLAIAGGRGGFAAGSGPGLVALEGFPPFQPLICYEAIFPQERPAGRAEWLLHVTNDAWFGDSSGPWQHFAQARFRAIEQGAPLMRSANTGVSAAVDPYGRVVAFLPVGARGFLDAPLPAALEATPYLRFGETFLFAFLTLMSATLLILRPH